MGTVSLNPGAGSATFSIALPAAPPAAAGESLITDASGNLSFGVPGGAASAGQILIGQASPILPAWETVSGDGALTAGGALTVTKTGGVAFAPSATTDTTNANNITGGLNGPLVQTHDDTSLNPANTWDVACVLAADYTLANSTSLQKLFNASANGAANLNSGVYVFEGLLLVTGLSASAGNAEISILGAGAATVDSILWALIGVQSSTPTSVTTTGFSFVINSGETSPASGTASETSATEWAVYFKGVIRITGDGTVIPSIALVNAAAAVVKKNSLIRFIPISGLTIGAAAATLSTVGDWT